MADVNITNPKDRLNRSIEGFESSMHHLAEQIGETRETVEEKVQRAKEVIETPRRLMDRAQDQIENVRYRVERNPFPFLGVAFGVALLVGMTCAARISNR